MVVFILKHLPAYILYEEFNEVIDVSDYESYIHKKLKFGNGKNEIKENYRKLAYNVKKIPELVFQEQEEDELCDHLHFWLYDKGEQSQIGVSYAEQFVENGPGGNGTCSSVYYYVLPISVLSLFTPVHWLRKRLLREKLMYHYIFEDTIETIEYNYKKQSK
ncbi:PIR Superfamily Protein [Plasmodium ovale curtisi]|uniref:PIR Superfamily Protein n=1 Tax=Plasmodium ovale curtisi TaxID=864141 RepID=A0A1A8WPR2_PLAOA|nr:PIR Superfamily Protein [Plasmodium ovale curtisi]